MMQNFSANHYALIIFASAGIGWQGYALQDRHKNNTKTLPEFAGSIDNIVSKTGKKIDVLVGSCAVNMIETAYELYPSVNYLVGTQDCFPEAHVVSMFYYATSEVKKDKDMTAEEFAIQGPLKYTPISFIYDEGYEELEISRISKILNKLPFPRFHSAVHHPSLGAINISQIKNLTESLNELVNAIYQNYNIRTIYGIKKSRKEVTELAKCAPKFWILYGFYEKNPFECLTYDCDVDFSDLIKLFKKNINNAQIKSKCTDVLEKINQTVAYVKSNPNASTCGMNIYFPSSKFFYNKPKFGGKLASPYEDLDFAKDSMWDEFLKRYLRIRK
jgi:hypothetical protein